MLQTFCSLFLLEKSSFIIKTKHRFHLPKKLKAVRNFRSYKKPLHLDKNLHSLNKKNSMSSAMANLFLPHQVYLTSINHQNVIITFLVNLEHGDEDKKWRIILFLWVTGKDGLSRDMLDYVKRRCLLKVCQGRTICENLLVGKQNSKFVGDKFVLDKWDFGYLIGSLELQDSKNYKWNLFRFFKISFKVIITLMFLNILTFHSYSPSDELSQSPTNVIVWTL